MPDVSKMSEHVVTVCGTKQTKSMGYVLRIHIARMDGKPMYWREVYDVFQEHYPGHWAVQVFPPPDEMLDETNKYHLFIPYGPWSDNDLKLDI